MEIDSQYFQRRQASNLTISMHVHAKYNSWMNLQNKKAIIAEDMFISFDRNLIILIPWMSLQKWDHFVQIRNWFTITSLNGVIFYVDASKC